MGVNAVLACILPAMLTALGLSWKIWPPSMEHFFHGYRTPYAMMSDEVWEYAQKYAGTVLMPTGIAMGVLSISILLAFLHRDHGTLWTVFNRVRVAQWFGVLVPIVLTEVAMRRHYDKQGKRRPRKSQ